MYNIYPTAISANQSSYPRSIASQTVSSKAPLLAKLKESSTSLDEQKALVTELCDLSNGDINAVMDSDGNRLIDIAVEIAQKNNDGSFAVYLVGDCSADLSLCKAVYELSPNEQSVKEMGALIKQIYEATPLSHQPQFYVEIQNGIQNETLHLSLLEARKLAQTSVLFQHQWKRGHEHHKDFFLTPRNNTNFVLFRNVMYAAMGRSVDTCILPKDLPLLLDAVNYLEIKDTSPVIQLLVTADNLESYLNENSLTPDEIQAIQQASQQSRSTLSEEIAQKWNNLKACREIYTHIALYAKSDEDFQSVLDMIAVIKNHPGASNLFNDLYIYESLLSIGNGMTPHSERKRVVQLIRMLIEDNPSGIALFATPAIRNMLVNVGQVVTCDYARECIAVVIDGMLVNSPEGQTLFTNVATRDMLIQMGNSALFDDAREWIARAIASITMTKEGRILFANATTRDMLIMMGNEANRDGLREWIPRAIASITSNNSLGQTVFANDATRDMLIMMGNEVTDDGPRGWIARAIASIAMTQEGRILFTNVATRSMLLKMSKVAVDSWVKKWIARVAIRINIDNPEMLTSFASEAMRDILINAGNAAVSEVAKGLVARAIDSITSYSPEGRALFTNAAIRDMLINMGNLTTSAAVISDKVRKWIVRAIDSITSNNPEGKTLFANDAMRDMLINMRNAAISNNLKDHITKTIGFLFLSKRSLDFSQNESNKKPRNY